MQLSVFSYYFTSNLHIPIWFAVRILFNQVFHKKKYRLWLLHHNRYTLMEAPPRFELGRQSFADSCLTTWLCRLIKFKWKFRVISKRKGRLELSVLWSGWRGSNSLPPPWQGGALPDELHPHMVPSVGIEPTTRGFSVLCSTNWATKAKKERNGDLDRARTDDL